MRKYIPSFIVFIAAILLGYNCGGTAPSLKADSCIARYGACSAGAQTMDEYVKCRNEVDKDCFPQKGGQ